MFDDYDDDDLFNEMIDYGMFEECERRNSNKNTNNKPNGSCLVFIIGIGALVSIPIALLAHFFVA